MDLRRVDMRRIGLGVDAATAVAAAILPGGLPVLGAYEMWKKITGSAGPDVGTLTAMNMIAMQVEYLQGQIGLALTSCPPALQTSFLKPLADATTAVTNAQQAFDATPEADRSTTAAPPQTIADLLAAVTSLQDVAGKMTALAGCTTLPTIARWLCDDGTLAPGGDRKLCVDSWKKYALYGALGLGGLVTAVVLYKVVSD